jgi:hypothetical protein
LEALLLFGSKVDLERASPGHKTSRAQAPARSNYTSLYLR